MSNLLQTTKAIFPEFLYQQLDVKSLNILYRCDKDATTATPTEKPGACEDTHAACPKWAASGVCVSSPVFMSRACRKSCNLCGEIRTLNYFEYDKTVNDFSV